MQHYEPSTTTRVVRKLLTAVVAFGTTYYTKLSFSYYIVWMLLMFGRPDEWSSTVCAVAIWKWE
jgi:hypothetical protein